MGSIIGQLVYCFTGSDPITLLYTNNIIFSYLEEPKSVILETIHGVILPIMYIGQSLKVSDLWFES